MRVVFDTCVWVSAVRSRRGASFALLSQVGADHFAAGISVALYLQYKAKLTGAVAQGITQLTVRSVNWQEKNRCR